MKTAQQDKPEGRPAKAQQRRRSITVRLSRKVKLVYTWRARRRLPVLLLRLLTQALAPLLAGFTGHALAAPDGGTVVSGSASISKPTTYQTIIKQDTARAAIDWRSYNVAAGERVTYQQPSASSVTLNRVTGGDLSKIYGSIDANGVVVISNPAGIYFGQGAQVNVGGLVAGAMAISNADFNAGNYRFTGNGSGSVKNEGNIQAGAFGVALIGHTVDNSGRIEAGGAVIMGAGGQATLKLANDRLVDIAIDSAALNAKVSNEGVIHADGGNIILSARATDALLDTVLYAGGEMRADSLREVNGKIVLDGGSSGVVKVDGTLQARGLNADEKGGEVKVTGERILLASNSLIDVSGQAGGGQVHVGGGYQGKDPSIAHATDVVMQKDAVIRADATTRGGGGEVVLWSDHATAFAGEISARGGAEGGDGGRVETSGKYLQSMGRVDASAAKGRAGSWLLDPYDITIGNGASTIFDYDNGLINAVVDSTYLNANDISATLAGTNVTISTGAGGSQAGNINLLGSISNNSGSGTTLALEAAGQIYMGTSSSISGGNNSPLHVALHAGAGVSMDTGSSINTRGGTLDVSGTSVLLNNVQTQGGNATINASGSTSLSNLSTGNSLNGWGKLDVQAASLSVNNVVAGDLNVNAQSGMSQSGKLTVVGVASIDTGTSDVTLNLDTNDLRDVVKIVHAKNVSLANSSGLSVEGDISGDLDIKANGMITQFNALAVQGSTRLEAGSANDIQLAHPANTFTGAVTVQSGKDVTIVSNQKVSIDGQVSGNLDLRSEGIAQQNALTVGGSTTLTAGTGNDIDLQQSGNSFAGAVSVQSAKDVKIANSRDLALSGTIENDLQLKTVGVTNFDTLTVKGALNATSSNGFTQTGALGVHGAATFDAAIAPLDTSPPVVPNDIVLSSASNDLRGVIALRHANNVLINNSGAVQLEGGVAGALTVGSNGAITQAGTLAVDGQVVLNAGANNDITLNSIANQFKSGVSVGSGRNVSITSDSLQLDGTISGDLNAVAWAGSLTQSGALSVTGQSSLTAADKIALENAANSFGGPVHLETTLGKASLASVGNLTLTTQVATDLNVTTTGTLTQGAGPLVVVAGDTTLSANGIDVSGAGNQFGGSLNLVSGTTAAVAGTVAGNLNVSAHGAIGQGTQFLDVGGQTDLTVQSDSLGGILLLNQDNAFAHRVKVSAGGGVGIASRGSLELEGSTNGLLSVNAAGSITQSGALSSNGAMLTATGADHDILLTHDGNAFTGTVQFDATRDVSLVNAGPLKVSGHAGGNLSLTATTGSITQADALSVGGTATLKAQSATDPTQYGDITLDHEQNQFAGTVTVAGRDVSLVSAGGLDVAGHAEGNLGLRTTGGFITQSDILTVVGTTSLTTDRPGDAIAISLAGNDFTGAVTISSKGELSFGGHARSDVSITSAAVAQLEGQVDGALTVDAAGPITQSNTLTVKGDTRLTATGDSNNIALYDIANDFTGAVTLNSSGATRFTGHAHSDVKITSAADTQLEGRVDGALTVDATGAISQYGALTVTGVSKLTTTGVDGDILLGRSDNDFTGAVTLKSSAATTFAGRARNDLDIRSGDGTTLAGQVDGALTVNSARKITQDHALTVAGTSNLTAYDLGSDIQLDQALNDFKGNVTLSSAGATTFAGHAHNALTITSSNGTKLEGTVDGNLAVTAGGKISQDHALTVIGQSNLTTTGTGNDIVLDQDANAFGQKVVFESTGKLDIHSGGDLKLQGSAAGELHATAAGAIQQTARLTSGASTSFTATTAGNGITIDNAANNFVGATSVTSAGDASMDGTFGDSLTVTATNGNITLSGNVAGALTASGGLAISQGVGSLVVGSGANGGVAMLTAAGNIDLGRAGNVFNDNVTLSSEAGATISGHFKKDLNLRAVQVSQGVEAVTVDRDTTLRLTGNQDYFSALSNPDNAFTGRLKLQSDNNLLTLVSKAAVKLEGSANGLDLTAGGAITQSGDLDIRGGSFTTTGAEHDITLTNAGNRFADSVTLNSTGKADITSSTNLLLAGEVTRNLTATALDASILQGEGPVIVHGDTVLTTTRAQNSTHQTDIILENLNNAFYGQLTLNSAGKAIVNGKGTLTLSGNVKDTLSVKATDGAIIQGSGALTVGGSSSLTTVAGENNPAPAITLNNSGNSFGGPVELHSDGNVQLAVSGNLQLQGEVKGTLSATANDGAITQAGGALTVTGASTLTTVAGGNNSAPEIKLDNPANSFGGPVELHSAGDATLAATTDVIVSGKVDGKLTLQSAGDIGQSAPVEVGGTTQLSADGKIELSNPANDFKDTVTVVKADSVNIADANTLTTQGQTSGQLTLTSNGDLKQDGAWQVGGDTQLNAGSGSVQFDNPNNQFTGAVTATAGQNVTVVAKDPLTVDVNAGGDVNLTAPDVHVVDGNVGGNLNVKGNAFLSQSVLVTGDNLALALQQSIQRALTAGLGFASDNGPGSYRLYLQLANPPVLLQTSVMPTVEGSGILLPEDEQKSNAQ